MLLVTRHFFFFPWPKEKKQILKIIKRVSLCSETAGLIKTQGHSVFRF